MAIAVTRGAGTNDDGRLYVTNGPAVNASTVLGWWKVTTQAAQGVISGFTGGGGQYLAAEHGNGNNDVTIVSNQGNGTPISGGSTEDVWMYMALTCDGTTATLYVAAVADVALTSASRSYTETYSPTFSDILASGYTPFSADIVASNVMVYASCLTAAELLSQKSQYEPYVAGPFARWKLLDDATKTDDSSGNGNSLTASGGTYTTEADPTEFWPTTGTTALPAMFSSVF